MQVNSKIFSVILIMTLVSSLNEVRSSTIKESSTNKESNYYLPPFKLQNPDYVKSPNTGMTREEWIKCGIHILEGAFQYVQVPGVPPINSDLFS